MARLAFADSFGLRLVRALLITRMRPKHANQRRFSVSEHFENVAQPISAAVY